MEMTPETIRALLDAFDRSDWREMTVTIGTDRLHVSRDPSANGATPEPRAPAADEPAAEPETAGEVPSTPGPTSAPDSATPEIPASGTPIEAPSVGLFWRAPAPGAPPFVEVGQHVAAGDTVGIVEVMKLMNHVVAPLDGVVTAILVENGAAIEYGQPLVVVEPES
jgi:acetyl-CoA carboxylase biotin carboxyl carrier protein